jgi:hypothetical protein
MGLLINGVWQEQEPAPAKDGHFERRDSAFRNWITPDGRPGPTGQDGFRAMAGRYHLYVSLACPWAHRTLIMRALKGLRDIIPISVTHWLMAENGWTFRTGEGVIPDPLYNSRYVYELYARADADYTGRATVPILWDQHTQTIVNNESSDIIRMLGSAFDQAGATQGDYYPAASRADIDAINQRVYDTLNNGVYKAGFATTQAAYEAAVVRNPGLAGRPAVAVTLSVWRGVDRGRHQAVHDTGPFRFGLSWSFQVQHPAHRRLPESLGLYARHLPTARYRRDGRSRPHQAALLHEPPPHQSDRDRAGGADSGFRGAGRPRSRRGQANRLLTSRSHFEGSSHFEG